MLLRLRIKLWDAHVVHEDEAVGEIAAKVSGAEPEGLASAALALTECNVCKPIGPNVEGAVDRALQHRAQQ